MAYLSPGVYIKEIDNSAIVPTVANSTAFFAGNFTKGPIEQPFIVTNKAELELYFGQPISKDSQYNEWYQCSKFLDYSNQLVISRAFMEYKIYNPSAPGLASNITVNGAYDSPNTQVKISGVENIYINTRITFSSLSSDSVTYNVTKLYESTDPGFWEVEFEAIDAEGNPIIGAGSGLNGPINTGDTVLIFSEHQNAGADAYQNLPDRSANSLPVNDRLNQGYALYKNKNDFEFKADTIPFDDGVKLKFIAQTAGGVNNGIEISVINPYDFQDFQDPDSPVDEPSKAQAFEGQSILNFFEYIPEEKDNEIGIVIRDGDVTESYIVSFDPNSVDGNGKSKYVETVINENSRLVYAVDNLALGLEEITVYVGKDDNTDQPIPKKYLTYVASQIHRDSQGSTAADPLPAITPNVITGFLTTFGGEAPSVIGDDIKDAYFEVEDKELYEIDIVIGNEVDEGSSAISLAINRQDCIAMTGALYGDVVGKKSAVATDNLVNYILRNSTAPERTMFAAFFGNYFRIYDSYAKKFRWINCAGDMAGLRANTNTTNASWWASAGLRRGVIRNIDKIGFSPSLPQRDSLYKNNINPIVNFPGEGNLCWGQKTLLNYASSFDRINVRGLFNTVERAMAKAARSSVFEFNDPFTRNAILAMFNPYLSSVKAGRGISDFLVICDTSNNTPDVISRNELVVDIYIKPAYAAEFIQLTFNNVGTRSFATVVGA